MRFPNRARGRRRSTGRASQRKYTWVIVSVPPTALPSGTALPFELLSPIRPPSDITIEVYQNMTNPTVARVMGHVTLVANNDNLCATQPPTQVSYAWGLYKDSDAVDVATFTRPFSEGNSNEWMHHEAGTLFQSSGLQCTDLSPARFSLGSAPYRRYEFDLRKYKRRLDSQRDSLIFAVENPAAPFSNDELAFTAYFRILLLE